MRLLRAELARLFARRFTRWTLLLVVVVLGAIMSAYFVPHRGSGFAFWQQMPRLVLGYSVLMALVAYPVAASFVGAEWSSSGVASLLMWRPRRVVVFTGKLFALLLGMTAVFVVLGGAWVGGFWLLAHRAGTAGHGSRQLIESLAVGGARGLGLVAFATMIGFAIASLGRRTAAALGVATGYIVLGEIGARMVLTELQIADADRYLLLPYLQTWLTTPYGPAWLTAAAVLGGTVVVLVSLAGNAFRRRDLA